MKSYAAFPLKLVQNKIVRYPGGREIDRFRGVIPPRDDNCPEAWVGSDTRTVSAGHGETDANDGCAEVILPDGSRRWLFELLEEAPEAYLGAAHMAIYGHKLGVLVKLLDAEKQLGLQCHPSRSYAAEHFGSPYGKEESWYVIGLRDDVPEPPYVLMGFKEGVTRADFEAGYDAKDIKAMEACCHKVPVHLGDTFFIAAGLPHAIGAGCFVVEVQEPSDITVGTFQRWGKKDFTPQENEEYKQRTLGCYNYDGADYEENLRRYRIEPKLMRSGDWGQEVQLIGPTETSYFSFSRLDATAPAPIVNGNAAVGIVLTGSGEIEVSDTGDGEAYRLPLAKGDEFFLPAGITKAKAIPGAEGKFGFILARPGIA